MLYHEPDDLELACLLRDRRSPAVETAVYRRFGPLVEGLARRYCRQMFHRGCPCPGRSVRWSACDGVFEVAVPEIHRRIIGAEGSRPKRSLLVEWSNSRRDGQTFAAYLFMAVRADDILRTWCAERDLPVRGDRPSRALVDDVQTFYRAAWADCPALHHLSALSPDSPRIVHRWLEGLWRDAVQTGDGQPIDNHRLARWMLGTPEPDGTEVRMVAQLAALIDEHLKGAWPRYYERYLERGRHLTEPVNSLEALAS